MNTLCLNSFSRRWPRPRSCVMYGVALLLFNTSINIGKRCVRFGGPNSYVSSFVCQLHTNNVSKTKYTRVVYRKSPEQCMLHENYKLFEYIRLWVFVFEFTAVSSVFSRLKIPYIRCTGTGSAVNVFKSMATSEGCFEYQKRKTSL